ncbi:Asp-tRNA(Asn)/Glu-tRNA(Gln) amidotransferase subunit GatC [Thermosulfuriphilus ammonigenes]|uniref:Aspartyl/glutamyl-tRNA(Asn/Gln) amidotransferase subunit C n=1 Tax=Thermosulfuriphilus ammonigenes TaxID=1936021 RepID=A0A6G7PZ02_9BACT|nr:Asp-tRNA(Asn)/Glu-tRNA(Gln) amidotransferase subunit GatC [Thermosulfuriphilus ammonigenes]MBA2849095.1 aspartyl-tRNA(Asn)/glutamyl-tRNA(Gln) amidotransferase subunit C [Thermosulfuriphilus ammonigenes]QIJ72776.1 Asp-tRNA(Asn)/Glu-tRNA(Gln) amidotransferase subunit GatC [Thermosulfuriphilus ammonigenes]
MAITKEEVLHVAHLARLEFSSEEIEVFTRQLAEILEYVKQLDSLDTAQIPPTTHALALTNAFRDDEVCPSIDIEKTLANAPEREGRFFVVPRVIKS